MDPLELLPAELWRMIFEKVDDGQDWLNLYRASSSTFEGVVGDRRPEALITKVFPHLQKYLLEKSLNGLLSLRLVSRHWKKAVDKSLEASSEVKFGDSDVRGGFSDFSQRIQLKYMLRNPEIISRFLDKFSTHPGNPFIGSFVRFEFDPCRKEEMNMELRHSVERVMGRFGKHIRKLWIWADIGPDTRLDSFLIQLRSCVELAPNLEELTVQVYGRNGVELLLDSPVLRNQPLSIIPKLKSFCFTGYQGKPEFMVDLQNLLVRLCCNPDTLQRADMLGVPMTLTTFPNLETGSVELTRVQEDVANLMSSSWPLTRLALCPGGTFAPRVPLDASIATIVGCVEHFKETLTSLWIGNKCTGGALELMELGPDLPRLKYLTLPRQFMSVQFLRNLPRLEELQIFENGVYATENWVAVVESQLSEDKIWEVLPKLRKVKLSGSYHDVKFRLKQVSKVYYRD